MRPAVHRIILVAAALAFAGPAAADCQRFGATVSLTGQFMPAVLAMNGHDDPLGEPGRTADLLVLASSLCVAGDVVSPVVLAAASVQVLCPDFIPAPNGPSTITGRLVGANTGNGHPPVLLVCRP
jgi:hypothetical protein